MHVPRALGILSLLGVLLVAGAAAPTLWAADPITPDELRAHIFFLGHDLLEGRGVGTRGEAIAVTYLEAVMRAAGLEPTFGDSYRQEITLWRLQPDREAVMRLHGKPTTSRPLRYGQDFVARCPLSGEARVFNAELVYVGYGIVSEQWQWDDYKGVDLEGKIVVAHTNEPRPDLPELFAGKALTHFGRWTYKQDEAARQGALGVILIHTPEDAGYGWEVVRNSAILDGIVDRSAPDIPQLEGWISNDAADELFRLARLDRQELRARAQERSFQPVPLGVTLQLALHNPTTEVTTVNVAGTARGRGPHSAARTMVVSAHHDHLGKDATITEGDSIYNGAIDNGSALATLLAVARSLGSQPDLLEHDVVFLACAAEEKGLLGSAFFARNPPLPVAQLAANINLEMTHVWGPTRDILALGAEHSDLAEIIATVAGRHQLTISPDSAPEQGFFYRSDQYSFAHAGIPSVWLDCGEQLVDGPAGAVHQLREQYRADTYHRPSDELDPSWPLTGTVQVAELVLELLQEIDRRPEPPHWLPDSPLQRPE